LANLKISQLRRDLRTQSRAELCRENVDELREVVRLWQQLPRREQPAFPFNFLPRVFRTPPPRMYVLSRGFHRVAALEEEGWATVDCEVVDGDLRAAVLDSVGSNVVHSWPRSREDKRHSVWLLLEDPAWRAESNVWIAGKCGVSDMLVADVRDDWEAANGASSSEMRMRTAHRNGQTYTIDTGTLAQREKTALAYLAKLKRRECLKQFEKTARNLLAEARQSGHVPAALLAHLDQFAAGVAALPR